MDGDALYRAFASKDRRFDGRFFVGVSSTGIYCRPVCHARMPKRENCTFFRSAAEAEAAGFRPCLLCRPELAPGSAPVDATSSLARRVAAIIDADCGRGQNVETLAQRMGCTSRHLRRAFAEELGVSPSGYLCTRRLLLAKQLLTDTDLPVSAVAHASGFGSLRRFDEVFSDRYRMRPSELRKRGAHRVPVSGSILLSVAYREPYAYDEMIEFLAGRAIPGVEAVTDGAYARTCRVVDGPVVRTGWIRVRDDRKHRALSVEVSDGLLPVLSKVLGRVRHLFDAACDPSAIWGVLQGMNDLRPGLAIPGIRVPGCFDGFEMAVRAVFGQQVTVRTASAIAGRVAAALGEPIETGTEGLTVLFPPPEVFAAMVDPAVSLGPLGVTGARARAVCSLACAVVGGDIELVPTVDAERQMDRLLAMRGIGPWTAGYLAMRALAWPDAFLETDAGVRHALPGHTPKELATLAEAWRPWRSYAMFNLWGSLSRVPPEKEA